MVRRSIGTINRKPQVHAFRRVCLRLLLPTMQTEKCRLRSSCESPISRSSLRNRVRPSVTAPSSSTE